MRVVILNSAEEISQRAADSICRVVRQCNKPVLGLATGGTPIGTYQELVRRHQAGTISFQNCLSFNLDEYVGLPAGHPESYRSFMERHLFHHTDFQPQNYHLPLGKVENLNASCAEYEELISAEGGIDLQLLGIGSDGHIAFNEPGSSLASRTRVKALTEQTRSDNARFFDSIDEVPKLAITMGIGTIMDAREIVLLASGAGKSQAVRSMIEGPISASVPASILQMHPHVSILLDAAAAADLERKSYYLYVEEIQKDLEASMSVSSQSN